MEQNQLLQLKKNLECLLNELRNKKLELSNLELIKNKLDSIFLEYCNLSDIDYDSEFSKYNHILRSYFLKNQVKNIEDLMLNRISSTIRGINNKIE